MLDRTARQPGFLRPCLLTLASLPALLSLGCEGNSMSQDSTSIFDALPAQPSPAQAAKWMLDPYDPDKRFRGTVLLANAPFGGERVYVDNYLLLLKDSDASVRGAAAFAIGQHGSPEHVPEVLPLLADKDRIVRLSATRALQRLHNPAAIDPLIAKLDAEKETDADVRAECATALGQYASPKVLQALIASLDDDRYAVTAAAAASLRTLTGEDLGQDRAAWFKWEQQTKEPFAKRGEYTYPIFTRDKRFYEYIPFWTPPPNETPAPPAGMATGT